MSGYSAFRYLIVYNTGECLAGGGHAAAGSRSDHPCN